MLTRAQNIKRKWQQDGPKGNKNLTTPLISKDYLGCV
jgi:hypothetical protein